MANRYNWGIYNGINGVPWDRTEKEENVRNQNIYMLNRSLLMFKYTGLPDTIPAMELERLMQTNGFVAVTEVKGDLYAFYGGLGGMPDAYGRPTQVVISNPYLKYNATLEIDEDAILMRNDSLMLGLMPLYSKYNSLLNENEITMELAGISKRVNNLISVADDNTADSAKQYLNKLQKGELGYIFESKLFDSLKTSPMGSGGHVSLTELIELQQYLKASLYNEIGLNANYNMKRERLNTSEVEMNSDNIYPLVDNMLENRRIALDKINDKYGTNVEVEFNSSWDYRINQGEEINIPGLGTGTEEDMTNEELYEEEGLEESNEEHTDKPDEEPNGGTVDETEEEESGGENDDTDVEDTDEQEEVEDKEEESEEEEDNQ